MKHHSQRFLTLVTGVKQHTKDIKATDLHHKMANNEPFILIDVREDNEWATGAIAHAIHLSKGVIERDIEKIIPDTATPIVVYCSGGFRSTLVADSLQKMGYQNVYSLEKGLQGWFDGGFSL